ncbi:MAG: metal ABC transporter ATP-binding protein [Bdellovibrionota bacterium]
MRKRSLSESLEARPEHSSSNPLSVHSMTVAYDQRPVLWDMEFDCPPGALTAIVGPNGAGKSTLIKACLDLIPRATGIVEFWGKPYREIQHRIGYVPQRESVDWNFPISALEVVCMGRYRQIGWLRRIKKSDWEAARYYLAQVGLEDFASRQINQLSGGQQQRVFLARALAQEADLYFMDEPFAGVDATTEKAIIDILQSLLKDGKSVIAVHHDLSTVREYFQYVLMINTRMIAAGAVTEVFNEANLRKTFGGRLALLDEVGDVLARATRGEKLPKDTRK